MSLNSAHWDNTARLDDTGTKGTSWRFSGMVSTIAAYSLDEVIPSLMKVEEIVEAGHYGVGFIAYEAASALNASLTSLPAQEELPLVWFTIFEDRYRIDIHEEYSSESKKALSFNLGIEKARYLQDVHEIRERIAKGECYQANYTFSCYKENIIDPEAVYRHIILSQKAPFCAWLDTGRFVVMSASPELFFKRDGDYIVTRPMKGTAARENNKYEDEKRSALLADDPKERAENLMIVDLLRNDLGMISETGSVHVDKLFDVETYPTLHQITSTISAKLKHDTNLVHLFKALFPCGSVTGAPKRKSMEILSSLEKRPRGVYCGAIGMVAPNNEALFSVPIRTLLYDRAANTVSTGVGSGITWDSNPVSEFDECLTKMKFTGTNLLDSGLIESLRCEDGTCQRMGQHLERMEWSAQRIGIPFDLNDARLLITTHAAGLGGIHKVRLQLTPDGKLSVNSVPVLERGDIVRVALSKTVTNPNDLSLYLKLSDRSRYEMIKNEYPDADEVIITNIRGELTEGTYNNLVLKLKNKLVTPPLSSGLLPGVMRGSLLDKGEIIEQVLYESDLYESEEIWLINSVREWRKGTLVIKH